MLKLKSLPVLLFVAAGALSASAQDAQTLYQDFQHPGQPYRPRVWWHWMNGNITKDGIYKDLTWMKCSGIGGFHVFDAGLSTPQVVEKRLPYMTPEWKDAFHYAIHLADSLGLEATMERDWRPMGQGRRRNEEARLATDRGQRYRQGPEG